MIAPVRRARAARSTMRLVPLRRDPVDLIENAERVLCDLDGCLLHGAAPAPGAIDFWRRFGHKTTIVSNNSTDTPASLTSRLAGIGLPIGEDRLMLAGVFSARLVARRHPNARVLCLATETIAQFLSFLGLSTVERDPDAVLLCRDLNLDFDRLQRAVAAAHDGVPFYVANSDNAHPGADGVPQIETGAILALIQRATPIARLTVSGKPRPEMFFAGLGPVAPARAVMIGDHPHADSHGARALGIPTILVGRHAAAVALDIAELLDETSGSRAAGG
jgi:HAD superfamily hydrolase (TIGR01450 family)